MDNLSVGVCWSMLCTRARHKQTNTTSNQQHPDTTNTSYFMLAGGMTVCVFVCRARTTHRTLNINMSINTDQSLLPDYATKGI